VLSLDHIFAAAATEEWAAHGARAVLGFHWMVLGLVHCFVGFFVKVILVMHLLVVDILVFNVMFSLLRHMMRIHGKYGNDDSEEDGHLHSRYRFR
jgi:hypothetical protein